MSFSTQDTDVQNELQKCLQMFNNPLKENAVVYVISLGLTTIDCPGMLPEEKVRNYYQLFQHFFHQKERLLLTN